MTMELNQNGFQVVSRDKELHEHTGLGKFLEFIADTVSVSDNPQQVIEDGVKAVREVSKAVKP